MANQTTNLDVLSSGDAGKEQRANELIDAASPATLFGRHATACSGRVWGYYGGKVLVDGVLTSISNSTLTLTASSTCYVEATRAGVVSFNTTGFTAGQIPLYQCAVGTSTVTDYTDYRSWAAELFPSLVAKSMASDANVTLTAAESRTKILEVTSAVTLTATRNVVLPLAKGLGLAVYNGTTGAQSLQYIGATGTGVTVANGKRARIYCDGTNWVRETADV
jgi:hypothetical protein